MKANQNYNPFFHHRRSIRLKDYDYSKAGCYFITICCFDKICRFGAINHGKMKLNEFGKIAYKQWELLPDRFSGMQQDVFQIMPNHLHAIIVLKQDNNGQSRPSTVPDIVSAYKSIVNNEILDSCKLHGETMGKLWQRNYYEHIIRNEQAYRLISEYILRNPMNWKNNELYSVD